MKFSYTWLNHHLHSHAEKNCGKLYNLPAPEKLAELLTFNAFQVESVEKAGNDFVLDIEVLPNRSHDCLSHKGIARETARLLGKKIYPEKFTDHKITSKKEVRIDIREPKLCSRYMGVVIEDVKIGLSPAWLKERLETLGQRSINNIVDITNFVMLETGQPLHAFDMDKLARQNFSEKNLGGREKKNDNPHIVVRNARDAEKLTLLDGKEITLNSQMLVIADGDNAIAMAGIKGGRTAEISDITKNIVIESANFDYAQIRKTSRTLGIRTDSSSRFEQGISPVLAEEGIRLAIKMILKIASDKNTAVGKISDSYLRKPLTHKIKVSTEDTNKLLGTKLKDNDIEKLLKQLDFIYEKLDTGKNSYFMVTIPLERLDLMPGREPLVSGIKEDIIEEIGRVYGYKNIKAVMPKAQKKSPNNEQFDKANKVRESLVGEGFSEVMTYAFTDKGDVEIENPIAGDKRFLRNNLKDGISEALVSNMRNAPLLGFSEIKIFEIGTVFKKDAEKAMVAVGSGKGTVREYTLDEAYAEFVKPESANIKTEKKKIINPVRSRPRIASATGTLGRPASNGVKYKPISQYPFLLRDIAVFTPEGTTSDSVLKIIEKWSENLLVQHKLFDVFHKTFPNGTKRTSYAFNLVFQSYEKTLSDDEINKVMDYITNEINVKSGWQVR